MRAPTWRRVCLALLQVQRQLWTKAWAEGTATSDSILGKSGGWYPKLHSKGDRPVAETGNELCAYSTHESYPPTSDASTSTTNCRDGSGATRMGGETKQLLSFENAASAALDHLKAVLVEVEVVKGAASWLKLLIKRMIILKHRTRHRRTCRQQT